MKKTVKLFATAKNKIDFAESQLPQMGENDVFVKSLFCGISHATEMAVIEGTIPTFSEKWLEEYRCFVSGKPSKAYPASLGYENVVDVLEIGSKVRNIKVGDILWIDNPHQTYSVIDTTKKPYLKIPDKSYVRKATLLVATRVALAGIHDAIPKIGDSVLISGLGAIGLLTIQLLKLSGVSNIFASDPIRMRRELAEEFGAISIDPTGVDVALFCHRKLNKTGVDIALDTSGSIQALNDAIRSCSVGGRVITIATYRNYAEKLFLGGEWHRNRIELISSMSVNGCPHRNFPLWNLNRLNETALDLIIKDKINTEGLITQEFPFLKAKQAYNLIRSHSDRTVKVILNYGY